MKYINLQIINKINQIGFFKHSKNYFIGNIIVKGIAILILPIFTHLLSTEDYGIIAIYQTAVSVLVVITGLGMEAAIRYKYLIDPEDFKNFLGSVVIGNLLFSILLLTLCWTFRDFFLDFFGIAQDYLFGLVLFNCFFQFLWVYYSGYLTYSKQSKKYVLLQSIIGVGAPLVSILLILNFDDRLYLGRILPILAFAILTGIYSLYSLGKLCSWRFIWKWWKFAFLFSLPLIPHNLSQYILAQFDRVIINQINGQSDTGLYSFAYTVAMLMHTLFTATFYAWLPIFYKNMNEKKYSFINEKAIRYIKVILLITAAYIIFAKEAVLILADPKFYGVINIIPVLILSMIFIFLYMMYGAFTHYNKKNLYITLNTFIAGGLNILLNYIFIPKYGYFAAAYTTLASYLLLYILNRIAAYIQFKKAIFRFKDYALYLFVVILSVPAIILLNKNISGFFVLLIIKVVMLGLILLLFYDKTDITFVRGLLNKEQNSE